MENVDKNINALDEFLKNTTSKEVGVKNTKKVILDSREGLIERVDKVFITKDGKQLLREQY